MQFTVSRSAFQRALTLVNHAVARGNTDMALLAYVRLEIEASLQRIKLQATNLEISLTTFVSIEQADEPGILAIPAKLLMELVAALGEERLTFVIDSDIWKVKVTHAAGKASFMGLSAQEYPPIPEVAASNDVQVFPGELTKVIREVGVSVAREDSRPVLTCVLLQGGMERLTLATADGRRVSYGKVLLPAGVDGSPLGNILIPQRALAELASILSSETVVMVSLNANRSQVIFSTPTFVFSAILMSGEFPNYLAVVPTERPLRVEVKTDDFLRIVRASRIFTGGEKLSAQFSIRPGAGFAPGSLTISSKNEVGSNSTTIPAMVRGEALDVTFNVAILWDALQVISTAETALEIGQATSARTPAPAGILMPVDGNESVHAFMSMKA